MGWILLLELWRMRKQHPILTSIKEVLLATGYEHTYIIEVSQDTNVIMVKLMLPYHIDLDEFKDILENLKQELNAHDYKITEQQGKKITILFGKRELTMVDFNNELLNMNSLKVSLPNAFGCSYLDFSDDASCHLLIGGTTRTGKSSFLLYLASTIYTQTKGKSSFYIVSTKAKDFYSLNNLKNVKIARFENELLDILEELINEYKLRDEYLYSKYLEKATNAKDVLKHYPSKYYLFQPIFLIIDEYARFSDNRDIQKLIMELAETAGYVNIHLIIATQRPDARTVISPRIKANLLSRICFTTTDANNSILVLDQEGAEKLGRIKGRAIFLDGETNIIQVPKIESDSFESLLKPYKKENVTHEESTNKETTGSNDSTLTNKIQDMFKESISFNDLQEQYSSNQRMQSSDEASINGWFRLASKEGKG
jgi:hypothetical protein